MNTMHLIAPYVHGFFHQYLAAERGLSPNTIACYRDSLKLLFQFAAGKLKTPIDKLAVEHFSADVVLAFLNHLETTRGNSARTRNNRLTALHAFFRHVARLARSRVGLGDSSPRLSRWFENCEHSYRL